MKKPNAAKLFAKQLGWQEAIVRLLILRPRPKSKRGSQISYEQGQPANHDSVPTNSANQQQQAQTSSSTNENIPSSQLSNENTSVINRPNELGINRSVSGGLDPQALGAGTPAMTPQFTKKALFHDPTESDLASLCAGNSGRLNLSNRGPSRKDFWMDC